MLVDGQPVMSCLVPVCQVDGSEIQTVEGLSDQESAALDPLVLAVEQLWDAGVVVVTSAGNFGRDGFFTERIGRALAFDDLAALGAQVAEALRMLEDRG